MNWLIDLVTNPFLITGVGAWLIAQVAKGIIHWIVDGKFDGGRFFGDGGMPSGHSATVVSVAVYTALACGTKSVEFAIAAILAIIVTHDAVGVRLETGKQAVIIKELMKGLDITFSHKAANIKLKEMVGHTTNQVIVGGLVGAAVAVFMYFVVF